MQQLLDLYLLHLLQKMCFMPSAALLKAMKVGSIVLGEDCALMGQESSVGRRGMCGMAFIFKIAGAMSEEGRSFDEIVDTVNAILQNLATFGVCLSACSLPGSGPLFKVGKDEMELGLGVHGEAGIKRVKMCTAEETVKIMLDAIIKTLKLKSSDDVAVFLNNLGGTSKLEQWVVAGEVHKQLTAHGIVVQRLYAGCIMTSLEMNGVQISILKLHKGNWLKYLDAETKACGWPGSPLSVPPTAVKDSPLSEQPKEEMKLQGPVLSSEGCKILERCLRAASEALISNENRLNELDSACGDGDTGTTLRRMGDGIINHLSKLAVTHPSTLMKQLSSVAEKTMGGTSGALYSLLLTMAGMALESESTGVTVKSWTQAWRASINGTLRYSQAKPGDRSMFDALLPACDAFESHKPITWAQGIKALESAVKAAQEGCEKTRDMKPRVGRACYVDTSYITDVDAGAYGVTVWLKAVFNELKK
ncbi:triokinase/FMN cyclase-like isoform X2 [Periplaneta americana]|uniref:triokinase/FMN cyclase-like isoform X2 n=1 Tax=Periplaneta americana TaxID=6978 RepID=UPI0037E852D7